MSKKLEELKNEIFGQGGSEKNQVFNLCAVMKLVGGYEQLMNLPLSTLKEIFNYFEFLDKESKKKNTKIKR